jgi:hypothetical protein
MIGDAPLGILHLGDLSAVAAQERLGLPRELARVLLEDHRLAREHGVHAGEALAAEHGARLAEGEVSEQAEALDGLSHGARTTPSSFCPGPCMPASAMKRAQDLVGALEDEVDARVAQQALVRVGLHVADARRDLQRLVGDPPQGLGSERSCRWRSRASSRASRDRRGRP